MLQHIREKAQGWLGWIIGGLIAIPFALWGIYDYLRPPPKTVIAEVNGVELSEAEFNRNVQQRRQQLRAMLKQQEVDLSFMEPQIKQSTLEQMIEDEVLTQSALDVGLRVGDSLLAKRIHEFSAFQQSGTFSQNIYEQALRHQGLTPNHFEMQMRRVILTEQIREGILRSALLTTHDLQAQTRLEEQQRAIRYLMIPTERFDKTVTVSDAEAETYYHAHTNQYMTLEKVSIEYIELSQETLATAQAIEDEALEQFYQERLAGFTTPAQWQARHILIETGKNATVDEIAAAEKEAQALLAKIKNGDTFETLAKQFSDDSTTADKGGDLGWFQSGTGQQIKAIEDAVTTLKKGEVSAPVKSPFGFHLIKLTDSKPAIVKPFAEVKEVLKNDLQKEHAESEFYSQLEQLSNLAFENPNSLKIAGQTLNLPIKSTDLFDHTGIQDDAMLSHPKIIKAAFSEQVLQEGYNSDVIEVGEQQVVVLRVKDHQPAEAKPLSEVKAQILLTLKKEKTKEAAQKLGKKLLDELTKNIKDPYTTAKNHDLTWSAIQWIKRQDTTLKYPKIVQAAFKMGHPTENKAIYQGIELNGGNYVLIALLAIEAHVLPDASETEQKEHTQKRLALGEDEFKQVVSSLKAKADIKTYADELSM
jgi:peptidyl-prolyl cis-trans isomerase D